MNKYIKAKSALFFVCIALGAILLIYTFTAVRLTSDPNTADNKNYGGTAAGAGQKSTLSAENDESPDSKKSADYDEKRSALFAQENDGLITASRGDIDRYNQSAQSENRSVNSSDQPAEQTPVIPSDTAAAKTAKPAPAETIDPSPVKTAAPAAKETPAPAPAPAKTTAPAAKPAAAPAAASAAPAAKSAPAAAPAASKANSVPVEQKAAAAAPAPESGDLDLLARLITAEAQGEPFEGQVAVGAVVMNRVKSSDWPNSIKSVIYQKIGEYYQFTPVVNGWINKPAQPEAVEAAKAAMNGSDPTNGAQFYYDDKCTNEWILAKPVSLRVGHMIFAY